MKRKISVIAAAFMICLWVSGCTDNNAQTASTEEVTASEIELETEGLSPVYGADIKNGSYKINVDSSSSMFRITDCVLTVDDGKMTASMTMGGKGYLKIFMGKGENAVDNQCIGFTENKNGEHVYTVEVAALDIPVDCAAFSKNREKWYDRTLIFRSESLPVSAYADGVIKTADSLALADGEYTVDVSLEGGSGRTDVSSPAKLTVSDGQAFAEIVWSSPNFDYMLVDDVRYDMTNDEGNSTFVVPVLYFDRKMPVAADTTAMSVPHEIEYTLYFDSESIK